MNARDIVHSVYAPETMNSTFVAAFNSRTINSILHLFAEDAVITVDSARQTLSGKEIVRFALGKLLEKADRISSRETLCMVHGDLALLRADVDLRLGERVISTHEMSAVIHRGANGLWRYAGATLPGFEIVPRVARGQAPPTLSAVSRQARP